MTSSTSHSHDEPRVPRRLHDPEMDGAGQQVRTDNDFDQAAAARGSPTRAGVAAALGYGPASVDLSEGAGTRSLARPSFATMLVLLRMAPLAYFRGRLGTL